MNLRKLATGVVICVILAVFCACAQSTTKKIKTKIENLATSDRYSYLSE